MEFIKGHYQLFVVACVVGLLWGTPVFMPLRLLVIFFHELSHGLAAYLTGGKIISLTISPLEGGMAATMGGNRFWTASAGYIGSLLWGILFFLIALRTNADRITVALLGALMLLITVLYIRTAFAVAFSVATGIAMLLMARFLGHIANDLMLRIIGLSSMFYVPWDIFDDTIARHHMKSDAHTIANEIGGPALFWGGLWLVLSLLSILICFRYGLGTDSNLWKRKTGHQTN